MHNTGSDGRPFEYQPDNIAGCGLWKPEDVLAQLMQLGKIPFLYRRGYWSGRKYILKV